MEGRDALGYPPKHKELRRMDVQYSATTRKALAATESETTTPETSPLDCYYVARAVNQYRVLALNEESLKAYFDGPADCIRRNEILPDMWGLDEKGFKMGRVEEE